MTSEPVSEIVHWIVDHKTIAKHDGFHLMHSWGMEELPNEVHDIIGDCEAYTEA
jgi:hypothetical protein